jgi:hypothetical protein
MYDITINGLLSPCVICNNNNQKKSYNLIPSTCNDNNIINGNMNLFANFLFLYHNNQTVLGLDVRSFNVITINKNIIYDVNFKIQFLLLQ